MNALSFSSEWAFERAIELCLNDDALEVVFLQWKLRIFTPFGRKPGC
jgi:hypothetical protein